MCLCLIVLGTRPQNSLEDDDDYQGIVQVVTPEISIRISGIDDSLVDRDKLGRVILKYAISKFCTAKVVSLPSDLGKLNVGILFKQSQPDLLVCVTHGPFRSMYLQSEGNEILIT
jgi:hypothetical protein